MKASYWNVIKVQGQTKTFQSINPDYRKSQRSNVKEDKKQDDQLQKRSGFKYLEEGAETVPCR